MTPAATPKTEAMPKDYTAPLGFIGSLASFTIGQLNDLVGIGVGLLTAAYLIRKHVRLSKQKEDKQ
jgi:hypothetical protein